MISKKIRINKVKISLKSKSKDILIENNKSEIVMNEHSKSQFSKIKIEEYLASITKK